MSSWLYEGDDDGPRGNISFEQALSFERRLESWKASQPDVLGPNEDSPPHILLLSLHYYDLFIAVFKPFIEDAPAGLPSTDAVAKDPRAREICFGYIENLKDLLAIFRRNHGWNHRIPYMLNKLAVVALYELENLAKPESCASFLGSIEGIRQMADSWFVAKPILRIIELHTEKIDVPVPHKARQIFAFSHDEPWIYDDVGQVFKIYPSGTFSSEICDDRFDGLLIDMEGEGYEHHEEGEGDDDSGIGDIGTPIRQGDHDPVTPSQPVFSDIIMGASRNSILANFNFGAESCFQFNECLQPKWTCTEFSS